MQSPDLTYYAKRYTDATDRWSEGTAPRDSQIVGRVRQLSEREFTRPLRILDVGCGRLGVAFLLKDALDSRVVIDAVDMAHEAITTKHPQLASRAKSMGIDFRCASVFEFTPAAPYDVVLDIGFFHHIVPADWPRYRERLSRLLVPDGVLLLYSFHPNNTHWSRDNGDPSGGGHMRGGYYCHYHTSASLLEAMCGVFESSNQLFTHQFEEHSAAFHELRR